jgi:hypothetical protein
MKIIKRLILGIVGLFIVLVVIGAIVGSQQPATTVSAQPTTPAPASPASAPTPSSPVQSAQADASPVIIPLPEQTFVNIIATYMAQYNAAANDMAKGAARHARKVAICNAFSSPHISNWAGTIQTLDSTGSGNGVLSIAVNPNLTISTTNNDISDALDHTTIPAGSALFNAVSAMKTGDQVYFSGDFQTSDDDCFEEDSLTTDGSMQQPDFDFRFTAVREAQPSQ